MKKIVILGGGTAGWLTAMYIQKVYPANEIVVVEDPETPPIIAGESAAASLNKMYNFLEISINDWIKPVNAMPKLGGWFKDWNGIGTEFIHGLIPDWYKIDYASKFPEFGRFTNEFVELALASNVKMEDLFYNGGLQRINKLPLSPPVNNHSLFNVITLPMWHFDSRANADYLKQIGMQRGITLIEGKFLGADRNESGDITRLNLKDEVKVTGDWFFDCSGFARLLMHKVIGEPLVDNTDYFPACAVMAWWEDESKIVNYTDIVAMKYGWRWNINLHHRSGNGYIYDPSLISAEQAIDEVEQTIGRKINPVANLKFMPSLMKETWRHNVIAVGLSNGFLEPLESNGLDAVVRQLQILTEYWTPVSNSDIERKLFNKRFLDIVISTRDFLAMHYRGHRRDTEFWRSHGEDAFRIPETLQEKLDVYSQGCIGVDDQENFPLESYATVMQGLDLLNVEKLRARLLSKRSDIFKDFDESYKKVSFQIEQIRQICYTTEQWNDLFYGK